MMYQRQVKLLLSAWCAVLLLSLCHCEDKQLAEEHKKGLPPNVDVVLNGEQSNVDEVPIPNLDLKKDIHIPANSQKVPEKIKEYKLDAERFGFMHGFLASISVIIVSEIGDKTFFIAAIMAMKHSRVLVFVGALSALGLMTFLSVCLGYATLIIPRSVTFYTCTALLALFGIKMLYEGYKMSPEEGQEEFKEVSEELRKREETLSQTTPPDAEQGLTTVPPLRRRLRLLGPLVSPIFIQAFTLTFLAEWGDRSQLTTIVLGAREDPIGVTIGGTLGHALCTALAVVGGKIVAQRISVRTGTLTEY